MAYPTNKQIEQAIAKSFGRQTNGMTLPPDVLAWCVYYFKKGYSKGQDDFMRDHDWYE